MGNRAVLLAILCLAATSGNAAVPDKQACQVQQLGWHFYCDPDKEVPATEEKVIKEVPKDPGVKTPDDYIAERDAVRKEIEWKLSRAILYPTEENILEYIRAQRQGVMDPSTEFTHNWQKAIWTNPELDYTLKHPVSTIAKQVAMDDSNKVRTAAIDQINGRYGVFFFYSSTCIYCQKFSPILKVFSEKHNMQVMAISMDGVILPDWPASLVNSGQAEKMGVAGKPVPATILYDKESKRVIPVGYGLMAMDELEERIYTMTSGENDAR